MLTATVSGSFHRHMSGIYTAVGELTEAGVRVLSPSDPRVVDHLGEFLFVASDRLRSVRLVQDRHLHCINSSSFVWLVVPDGYVGQSASMEIGFATAAGVTVFCDTLPSDLTLQQYVRKVENITDAIEAATNFHSCSTPPHVVVDPETSIEAAHQVLDRLSPALCGKNRQAPVDAEGTLRFARQFLSRTFGCFEPQN